MSGFVALLRRDLHLVWRRPGDVGVVLAFFVVATVLFPLGIGPETNVLARIAAGGFSSITAACVQRVPVSSG